VRSPDPLRSGLFKELFVLLNDGVYVLLPEANYSFVVENDIGQQSI
jgi:hypothetical protein